MAAGLVDTNIVILLKHLPLDAALPDPVLISSVTLAELSVGPLAAEDGAERARRAEILGFAEAELDTLPFDDAVARTFGQVGASLRRRGRKVAARGFDAMIAATAMTHGLPLFTCNPADFAGIDGLDIVAVPRPG